MKNTKYLFDGKPLDGLISVSQLQTFLSCKKKWEYNYIENLKPRVDRTYLTIGRLCHIGMQFAMYALWNGDPWQTACDKALHEMEIEFEEYRSVTPHLVEEIPEFEKLWEDAKSVFTQAFEEFEPWKYEVLTVCRDGMRSPALELHFKVPCPPTKGMHGFIDAILKDKETGFIWCVDYKFRKSLSPDEDEAYNIQNAVYSYACAKMGINITGIMTWQHLNTPAADPQVLKDGKISRAKIKTTWEHYKNFCIEHGQDPEDYYLEMEEKLREIKWFRPTFEYRNEQTIKEIWKSCVLPVAKAIKKAHTKNADNFRSLYPWNCKMCQYQSICQAELRDYDVKAIKDREYVVRTFETEETTTAECAE